MECDADRAARYLERAVAMLKMADEVSDADPEASAKLMGIAESYQRMAEKLMRGINSANSN